MADLRKWEQERGKKVNLKDMHFFIDTFKSRDNLSDLAAPFARFDKEESLGAQGECGVTGMSLCC